MNWQPFMNKVDAHYPLSILSVFSATRPTLRPFYVHVFVVLCLRQRSPTILNAVVVGHTAISTKGTGKDWRVGCKERGNQWPECARRQDDVSTHSPSF